MRKLTLLIILMLAAAPAACSSSDTATPAPVAQNSTATTAPATPTPASVGTAPLPTAAPTNTPAPPTATATLTTKPTATATKLPPTDTPVPQPTTASQVYVIQEFDTLLDIAIQFDTTVEAITAANSITEGEFLQIGQEIIIPAPGQTAADFAPQTETATTQPTAKNTDSPKSAADQNQPADTSAEPTTAPAVTLPLPANSGASGLPTFNRAGNINPLTGLPVSNPELLRHRPLMVRVGNDAGARTSQVGLNRAALVYEEIAEWWVTRFSAIYLGDIPDIVAPVRSARLINTQLGPQYNAAVAHSGGSDPVRWEMTQIPIANLDQWFHGSLFFHRPNQNWMTRAAFKAGEAYDYLAANGLDSPAPQIGFKFSQTAPPGGDPAPNIFIPYPRATSFTQWKYDPASGKYLRWVDGAALVDAADGSQIAASNVIVYFADHQETDIVEDSNGGTSIRINLNGLGAAWFYRDGKQYKGTWQNNGSRTPYFGLPGGAPFPMKPGNTWVEVVPTYFKIGINSPDEASSRP